MEKWNFNVGEYRIFLLNEEDNCRFSGEDADHKYFSERASEDDIRVIVPEGQLSFFDAKTDAELWNQKFDSPIVGVWELEGGHLRQLDLFSGKHRPESPERLVPTIYVGSHHGQIYVQQSRGMKTQIHADASTEG